MEQLRNLAAAVGVAFIATVAAGSATGADLDQSGFLVVQHDSAGVGLGFKTGTGKLTLKDGSVYAVSMDGYSLLGLGYALATSTGKVYNLQKPSDLSGEYTGTGLSGAFVIGRGRSALKNDGNNVRIVFATNTTGLLADGGLGSVTFKLGKQLKAPDAPPPIAAVQPVPIAPKPVPIPVVLPKPTDYTLYFGFDKARVNLSNGAVLNAVLADWKDKAARFRIVGHADMVGPDKYNLRLSQRRADAVKAMLVQKGVPANRVTAIGVGQKDLAVQTERGKRLRQNRRVTLTIVPAR